ncbi:MAG: flavodoxin family protein [Alphaproteobacteria bacterium]|nr:flavodoxin family protein [Alphaproteobacteria bacterium SS10]
MATKKLLIIATDPSPNTKRLREAAAEAARDPMFDAVEVRLQTPQETQAEDVLGSQAVLFGTTENLGYMAGLTKDLFDRSFYEWEGKTDGLPVALYVRAGSDGTGTRRALESIFTGLNWRLVQPPLTLQGDWDEAFKDAVAELAQTLAAGLDAGIY